MAWDSISLTPRSYHCQKQGVSFPAYLFQKHVVCGSQMANGCSERGYRSIVFHWFPLIPIGTNQLFISAQPTPHRQHRPPADFYLGFGKTSRQLGGWAADSGECDSSLQGRPTLGQGGDGQCLNQRWPAMLRLLTRRFAHKPSAWLRPVTVSHNWRFWLFSIHSD